MCNVQQQSPGLRGHACVQGERPGENVLNYKRCGRGLTAAQRLQFCCGRGSLARIHGRMCTENIRIRTLECRVPLYM